VTLPNGGKGQVRVPPEPVLIVGGREIPLTGETLVIGREGDIEIPDKEKWVSKEHVKSYRDKVGQYWIEDMGSVNGTFVYQDGQYVRKNKWALADGDVIALCWSPGKGPYITLKFKTS